MRGIDARLVLLQLLHDCGLCSGYFYDNVGTITDEEGNLTDEQVSEVVIHLHEHHKSEHVVH